MLLSYIIYMSYKKPAKIANLMKLVKEAISSGRFYDTRHASERQSQRKITRPEMLQVLKSGFHEKRKDKFDENFNAWNYAVRGKTVDTKELRIIVSFDENNMLIITAIDLGL